ncbi:hypothetical protein L9F63_006878, partial [Diploptera punctata]
VSIFILGLLFTVKINFSLCTDHFFLKFLNSNAFLTLLILLHSLLSLIFICLFMYFANMLLKYSTLYTHISITKQVKFKFDVFPFVFDTSFLPFPYNISL